jgi:23S rRNA pseudouridine2605 synthase
MSIERVQKILARAGVASRRAAERLIADGRVRVNGRIVTEFGSKADTFKDRVEVDGKRVVAEHHVYYVLHKPREVVTTLDDPEQRESVKQLMRGVNERVFPVGRLDYHTSGALLMTNDGDMAQALLHPKKRVPKVYVAKIKGDVALGNLQRLREGVVLDDGHKTQKADVFIANQERGNTWLQITITEGKNRQVHRMAEAIGHRVQRLFRMSFAGIDVDGMRPGEYRMLTDSEIAKLKRDYLNPSQKEKAEQAREARRGRQDVSGASTSPKRSRAPGRAPREISSQPAKSPREFSSAPAKGPHEFSSATPAKGRREFSSARAKGLRAPAPAKGRREFSGPAKSPRAPAPARTKAPRKSARPRPPSRRKTS